MTGPWAIIAGALILVVGYIGYHEYVRHRELAEAKAVLEQLRQETPSPQSVWVRPPDPRVAAEAGRTRRGRLLGTDERCIGGLVVLVKGSAYTGTNLRCENGRVFP